MDQNKINDILNSVTSQMGSVDNLKKAAQSGNVASIMNSLTPDQQAMFNRVLNDKKEAERLLSSPEAIALMKALSGK